MKKRRVRITGIVLLAVAVLLVIASYLVDDPLRRYLERELNARLKGYSIRIGALTTHPLLLSVDLENLLVIQKANPEPPIAMIRRIRGGVHWRDLFTGHIVADATIDDPRLYINIGKLKAEIKKPPEQKEAWQETLEAITPITVNEFRIRNGEVTYLESMKAAPVTASGITLIARNVENVKSARGVYPSDIFLEAVLYGSKITMSGQADFLLRPHAAFKVDVDLHELDLAPFRQIAASRHIRIEKGVVSGSANVEYSPERKILVVKELTLANAAIDYEYVAQTLPEEAAKAKKAERTAKLKKTGREVVDKPGLLLKAKRVRIAKSSLGIVHLSADPRYRVFMTDLDLELNNFSNQFSEGPGDLYLSGQFMGSGDTIASGTFRPEKQGPDFNVRIAIKNTQMRSMNDLFRAYGKFDVSAGLFSFYSEVAVKHNKITGYVKPLFKDLKVYDERTDEEKSKFKELYEKILGGVVKLFENRPRDQVATETPIAGTVENPDASTWQILVNVVRNAFFQAILPGFEGNIR